MAAWRLGRTRHLAQRYLYISVWTPPYFLALAVPAGVAQQAALLVGEGEGALGAAAHAIGAVAGCFQPPTFTLKSV